MRIFKNIFWKISTEIKMEKMDFYCAKWLFNRKIRKNEQRTQKRSFGKKDEALFLHSGAERGKSLENRAKTIKKGLTVRRLYGKILPHWRTRTSTHDANEYSTKEIRFQQFFWRNVVFRGFLSAECL